MTARRGLMLLTLLIVLAVAWLLLRDAAPSTVQLSVVNRGGETVELELYGAGIQGRVATGPLASEQQMSLLLTLNREGELRLRAVSPRASVESQLLPRAAELRERALQLEVRDGNRFVLVAAD